MGTLLLRFETEGEAFQSDQVGGQAGQRAGSGSTGEEADDVRLSGSQTLGEGLLVGCGLGIPASELGEGRRSWGDGFERERARGNVTSGGAFSERGGFIGGQECVFSIAGTDIKLSEVGFALQRRGAIFGEDAGVDPAADDTIGEGDRAALTGRSARAFGGWGLLWALAESGRAWRQREPEGSGASPSEPGTARNRRRRFGFHAWASVPQESRLEQEEKWR